MAPGPPVPPQLTAQSPTTFIVGLTFLTCVGTSFFVIFPEAGGPIPRQPWVVWGLPSAACGGPCVSACVRHGWLPSGVTEL